MRIPRNHEIPKAIAPQPCSSLPGLCGVLSGPPVRWARSCVPYFNQIGRFRHDGLIILAGTERKRTRARGRVTLPPGDQACRIRLSLSIGDIKALAE